MIHISPIACTAALFHAGQISLRSGGAIYLYGPYSIDGYMVESNIAFDKSLRTRNQAWGIRSVEEVTQIAEKRGFYLDRKFEMPSNNLSLVFRKL
jgi:hypothetical protein